MIKRIVVSMLVGIAVGALISELSFIFLQETARPQINGSHATALRRHCHSDANQNQNQKEVKPSSSSDDDGRFAKFWKSYPRKVGKTAALKAWKRIKPNDDLAERMLHAIREQSKSESWRKDHGQFIPHPTTWLNQGRWDDEKEEQAGTRMVRGCRICGTTGSVVESQGGPLCIAHWNAGEGDLLIWRKGKWMVGGRWTHEGT